MNDAPAGLQANISRPRSRGHAEQLLGDCLSLPACQQPFDGRGDGRSAPATARWVAGHAGLKWPPAGGDLQAMRLLLDRTDGPVSAMNVECFADATISPRVEFILPATGATSRQKK